MDPFREASYEQLARILAIIDHYQTRAGGVSLDFLLRWTTDRQLPAELDGRQHSTEETIRYWERIIWGRS